jgi:hypothetical protein
MSIEYSRTDLTTLKIDTLPNLLHSKENTADIGITEQNY